MKVSGTAFGEVSGTIFKSEGYESAAGWALKHKDEGWDKPTEAPLFDFKERALRILLFYSWCGRGNERIDQRKK